MPSNATRAKSFTSLEETGRKTARRVLEGVANSTCMIIMGAGVSVDAGISDFRSPNGAANSQFQILGKRFKGRDIFTNTGDPRADKLAALNFIMTKFRQHARTAQLTDFHGLVATMLETGRAAKCLTRNFDRLETRDRPDLESKVVELHGNNESLSCPEGHMSIGPNDVSKYDADFLTGIEVPCPECNTKATARSEKNPRLRNVNTVHDLRPAVYLDERLIPQLHVAEERAELLSLASSCQVLLIAGTSVSTTHINQLVFDLADKVHESDGVVVCINIKDMTRCRIAHCLDYCLQIDVQQCARYLKEIISQQESFDVHRGKEIWAELGERDLTGTTADALPPLTIRTCCQCAHPIEEVLHSCVMCKETYCFESPYKRLGRMCVALDAFAPTPLDSFEESIKRFVCPDCFSYEEGKLYPHLVRRPRFHYETPPSPKVLVLVMYHLGAFWTISEHIEGSIVSLWASEGWAYSTIHICLQSLYEAPDKTFDSIYPPNTYEVLVVYVTHGVSEHGLFQISDDIALGAEKFLEVTTKPIQSMITGAHFSTAVFLACGQVYHVRENALQLQSWIDRPHTFNSMIGMLNTRLAPGYMTSFLAQVATNILGYHRWDQKTVLDTWLRNTLACTHTDLVYFGKSEEATIFLFSPMRSRPLGRELPSIHMTCLCRPGKANRLEKKYWIVKHRGRNGMKLCEVDVHIKCSLCKNGYNLRASDHQGTLVRIGGLYAAVVPYFLK